MSYSIHKYYAIPDIFYDYSGGKAAAEVINNLPDDAVIFEADDDFCRSATVYVEDKKIYSPFTQKTITFKNLNPYLTKYIITYDEFINIVRKMFPDVKDFWLLRSSGTYWNRITDLRENLRDEDLYYTDSEDKVINNERFSIYHINL